MTDTPSTTHPPTQADYSSESYARLIPVDHPLYEEDGRILHRQGYAYDPVVRLEDGRGIIDERGCGEFQAAVVLASGAQARLRVTAAAPDCFRIRLGFESATWRDESEMLLNPPLNGVPEHGLATLQDDQAWELRLGGHTLRLAKPSFGMELRNAEGRVIFRIETELHCGQPYSGPIGFRHQPGASPQPYLGWRFDNDDRYFGLGEKWNKVERTGTRATVQCRETAGSNTTDLSYKPVPVILCSAGWGMLVHTFCRTHWDIGAFSYTGGMVLIEDDKLDVLLFAADSLKGLTQSYSALTGRPSMPPKWALGLWVSRCMYENQAAAEWAMRGMRQHGIPADVIHLDPLWMHIHWYWRIGVDACDFVWNEAAFPDHTRLFQQWQADGWSICLWVNPYLPESEPIYAEAAQQGYLLKSVRGGLARLSETVPVGFIDFTNPAGRAWWQGKLEALLRDGAAVVKPDYGDSVPEDALGFDGMTGNELHNRYLHLYAETCFQAVQNVYGQGLVWRRAGYVGTQRFPGTWAGDTQTTWEAFKCCLRGGLSAGFTSECFWSHDIGGFVGPMPSPELYIRWLQTGLLSPLARMHGNSLREPWQYGATALAVAQHYGQLRYRLIPYLLSIAEQACATGLPMQRHLALEFEGEPGVEHVDDQICLGPELLLAPVLRAGARQRTVRLPRGRWYELESARPHAGGGWVELDAPLEHMPVLVRGGAALPSYADAPSHLKGPAPDLLCLDVYPADAPRHVQWSFDDGGGRVTLTHQAGPGGGRLAVEAPGRTLRVRIIGCLPAQISAPAGIETRRDGEHTLLTASGGLELAYLP